MNGININVTITSPDLHDAFLALAEAFLKMQGSNPPNPPEAKAIKEDKPKAKAPEPAAVEPAPIPEKPAAPGVTPEAALTLEDVRKLSMEKSKKDKAAVKAAISAMGASKVTDIEAAKYPEYAALLGAI